MSSTLANDGTRLHATPSSDLGVVQGVSTGCFYRTTTEDWSQLQRMAHAYSDQAVELSALSASELPALVNHVKQLDRSDVPFASVSVHAPAKGVRGNDEEMCALLTQLPEWIERIVLHPDIVSTWAPWRSLGSRLAVENMDRRKGFGCTPDELQDVFSRLPDARLCLDLAHVATIDPSMQLAYDLIDAHGERLVEVHISSTDRDAHHVPLSARDASRFDNFVDIACHVPWIYEALPS